MKYIYLSLLACCTYIVANAQRSIPVDSLIESNNINIPIYLVDGVECANLDSLQLDPEDISGIEVVKDSALISVFAPRVGGLVLIKTKSKSLLKRRIEEYYASEFEKRKGDNPIKIRGVHGGRYR